MDGEIRLESNKSSKETVNTNLILTGTTGCLGLKHETMDRR